MIYTPRQSQVCFIALLVVFLVASQGLVGCSSPGTSTASPIPTPAPSATLTATTPTSTPVSGATPSPIPLTPTSILLPPKLGRAQNVFLVFIDGVRYSESFGDPTHSYIPHIWNDLRPIGTIGTNFFNKGQTVTVPGHTSAITGIWQNIKNDGTERPNTRPTIFELFRKQKGAAATKTWVVVRHQNLVQTNYSNVEGYGAAYGAKVDFPGFHKKDATYENPELGPLTVNDASVWKILRKVFERDRPSLVMVNFGDTDSAAHSGTWSGYTNALRDVDVFVYYLWLKIQNSTYYRDRTTLIVTNDHGRGLDEIGTGFIDHGGADAGSRHVMFLAVGPNIRVGAEVTEPRELIDIGPTIAYMLGVEMPGVQGDVLNELFR